jgi:hypothetical protein
MRSAPAFARLRAPASRYQDNRIGRIAGAKAALEGSWEGVVASSPSEKAEAAIQEIRDGGTEKRPITTSIDGNSGTVRLSSDLKVEVEEVDGTWLVSNGTPVLFSFGVDEVP